MTPAAASACHRVSPNDAASHRKAAKVVATSRLADERSLKVMLWWLRRQTLWAQEMTYLRRGLVWSDEATEVVAVVLPPKTGPRTVDEQGRRHRTVMARVLQVSLTAAAMVSGPIAVMAVLVALLLVLPVPEGYGLFLGVVLVMAPLAAMYLVNNRRLNRAQPKGVHLIVNLARAAEAQPGQGSEFLKGLIARANASAWTLALRTCHPRLVDYYARHGFEVAKSARMPWRQTVYLMIRQTGGNQ